VVIESISPLPKTKRVQNGKQTSEVFTSSVITIEKEVTRTGRKDKDENNAKAD